MSRSLCGCCQSFCGHCQSFCNLQSIRNYDSGLLITTVPVDMKTQNGLRGFLVLYIVVFHCLLYSKEWNIQGSALMSFWFLMSGFTLAVVYGKNIYNPIPCCGELRSQTCKMNAKIFYRNRIARIIPTYYLLNFVFTMPLSFINQGWFDMQLVPAVIVSNLFAVQTWGGTPPPSFTGPAWTISTLVFFYWVFPSMLPYLQRLSHTQIITRIRILFLLNIFTACLILGIMTIISDAMNLKDLVDIATDDAASTWFFGFWCATAWPPSRLPVFEMGILAGLCCVRGHNPFSTTAWSAKKWAWRVDVHFFIFMSVCLTGSVISILTKLDIKFGFFGQVFFVWSQLVICTGICLDEGKSYTSKFLNIRLWHWLGSISMPLYLGHEIFIYYMHILFENEEVWRLNPRMPFWCVPIVIGISILFAYLVDRFYSNPIRKYLRVSNPHSVPMPLESLDPSQEDHLDASQKCLP